jgi:hypothetical protein
VKDGTLDPEEEPSPRVDLLSAEWVPKCSPLLSEANPVAQLGCADGFCQPRLELTECGFVLDASGGSCGAGVIRVQGAARGAPEVFTDDPIGPCEVRSPPAWADLDIECSTCEFTIAANTGPPVSILRRKILPAGDLLPGASEPDGQIQGYLGRPHLLPAHLVVPTYGGAYSGSGRCVGEVPGTIAALDPTTLEPLFEKQGPPCLTHLGGVTGDSGFVGVSRDSESFVLNRFDADATRTSSRSLALPRVRDFTFLKLFVPLGEDLFALFRTVRDGPPREILVRIDPSTLRSEILEMEEGTKIYAILSTDDGLVLLEDSADEFLVYDLASLSLKERVKITTLIEARLLADAFFHPLSGRYLIGQSAYSIPSIFAFELDGGVVHSIISFEEELTPLRFAPWRANPSLALAVFLPSGSAGPGRLALVDPNAGYLLPGLADLGNSQTRFISKPIWDEARDEVYLVLEADNEILRISAR